MQNYFSQDFYSKTRRAWLNSHSLEYQIISVMIYEISTYNPVQIDESKEMKLKPSSTFSWKGQSNSNLCMLLFHIELEEKHDPPTLLFWNPCFIKRLHLCSKWGNPVSMYYLSECIKFHLDDRKTEIELILKEKSDELLKNSIKLYQEQMNLQMDENYPYFEMGQLSSLLGISNGLDFYKSGMRHDIRCKARFTENLIELKKLIEQYPPVNFELALLDPEKSKEYYVEILDTCPYANFELALLQKDVSERLKLLKVCCNLRIYSACQPLCGLLFESGNFDEAVEFLKKFGENGYLFAFTMLGDFYESRDQDIANKYYERNPFIEKYKLYVMNGEKKDIIDELYNKCLKRLYDVVTGGEFF